MIEALISMVSKALKIKKSAITIKPRLKFSDAIHYKNFDYEFELQTSAERIKESEIMDKILMKSRSDKRKPISNIRR
ncbi:unnamed protein product [Blepharisma stoltei]|uniref:Uncharacterized protein n=1 Tax=Blepharisma stoltei TaxID=1481888 RepID=A0AAU9I8K2_9CILI|nr:unnamed protein product [Blepharisma stoltei]